MKLKVPRDQYRSGITRRALCLAMGASPMLFQTTARAAPSQIVDRAGSLRMLSQRTAKAYFQLGLGVLAADAETILAKSLTRFNGVLVELRDAPSSDKTLVKKIEADWSQYRDLLSATPTKASGAKVDALSESILVNAEALTAQLAGASSSVGAKLTNLCSRQKMLSQRMAKTAFELMWGIEKTSSAQHHTEAHDQFAAALVELKRTPQNTPKITQTLDFAESQFGFFDVALGTRAEMSKLTPARAKNVAHTNERLLEIFEDLTSQYSLLAV